MKQQVEFVVKSEDVTTPLRLDKFLVRALAAGVSRAQIQHWIKSARVRVNEKIVSKHYQLKKGDVVIVAPPTKTTVTLSTEPAQKKQNLANTEVAQQTAAQKQNPADVVGILSLPTIKILYEDDDIIVLHKPVGVLVHPVASRSVGLSAEALTWTVVDFLLARCPAIEDVGEQERAGLVHRLDRDVSGVMVAAKTPQSYENLKQQFMARRVRKEYRAIVHGVPAAASNIIKFKIARSKTKTGKMAARPEQAAGKEAWTEYDVLAVRHNRYALLEVCIRTGRTHQIRAHLAAIDHPVVGDQLYFLRRYQSQKKYPRLYLHSFQLGFQHPTTGAAVTFTAPLPPEFTAFMRT